MICPAAGIDSSFVVVEAIAYRAADLGTSCPTDDWESFDVEAAEVVLVDYCTSFDYSSSDSDRSSLDFDAEKCFRVDSSHPLDFHLTSCYSCSDLVAVGR